MKAKRRTLSLILATCLVVLLFQAVALAEPREIIGGGSFNIETGNTGPNPDDPDGDPVPVKLYEVTADNIVVVQSGAKITLAGEANDYRIVVKPKAEGDDPVEITLNGFSCDRTAANQEEGGSGTEGGGGTGTEGGSGTEGGGGTGTEGGSGTEGGGGTGTEGGAGTEGGEGTGTEGGAGTEGGEGTGTEGGSGTEGGEGTESGTANTQTRANENAGPAITLESGAVVTLILADGKTNTLKGGAGAAAVEVPAGASLTIEGKGTLNATASSVESGTGGTGAAIGGSAGQTSGNITINDGTVNAVVEEDARGNGAAIGGGAGGGYGNGTITINGGKVKATAAGNGAAIGGGGRSTAGGTGAGNGGTIVISGGTVEANGNIGGGDGSASQGTLNVSGASTRVTASELIGADITIADDGAEVVVEMDEDITVPAGQTMKIPKGMTLNIPSDKALTVQGTLVIEGKITGSGELNCLNAEGVEGADNIGRGIAYEPPCPHNWPDKWEKYSPEYHAQYCTICGSIRLEEHRFSNGICIECLEWEDPKYIFVETEKTLTVYKDFGGPDIETADWAEIAGQAEEVVVVEGVRYIPENAFKNFGKAKHIYIPESAESIRANMFPDNVDGDLTVYCPQKWSADINPTEDMAAKFVFYEMQGDLAVITQITDAGVDIPDMIYDKEIYLADGVLLEFPEVDHEHRIPADGVETADNRRHFYYCAICGKEVKEKHKGGEASCIDKAICEVCGDEYGTLNRSNHIHLVAVDAKMPTHLEEGNIFYYFCEDCDRFYTDSAGTERIRERETILKELKDHTPEQTEWLTDAVEHWHTCACGEIIDDKAHSFEWVVDREATETESGLRHQRCSVCGYESAAEEVPRIGGTSQGNNGGTNQGNDDGTNQPGGDDTNQGNNNGTNQGNSDGTNQGNNDGTNQGNNGGTNQGDNSGTNQGTNGGSNTGTSPGTNQGASGGTNTPTAGGVINSIKTGDYANLIPWIALLLVSGMGAAGAAVYYKKTKKSKK